MNFPSVPADNLYKFIAIASLIGLLAIIYIYIGNLMTLDERDIQLNGEIKILRFEVDKIKNDIHKIQLKAKKACEETNSPCFNANANIDSLTVQYPDSSKYNVEIESFLVGNASKLDKVYKDNILIQNKRDEIKNLREFINYLSGTFYATLFLLTALSVISFMVWYNRVQTIQDQLLEFEFFQKKIYIECQSCGINLLTNSKGLELDGKENIKYCINCYNEGRFKEDITLKEIKKRINKRLKDLKFNRFQRMIYCNKLDKLERWLIEFKW